MNQKPILIMAAMEVEADFFLKKIENITCTEINKYKFYEGTIKNYPVVICRCHVMTINAAVATSLAIQKYDPIAIISQGTAGGHGKNVHKGDIVIGERCINSVSCWTPKKEIGEGSNSLEWNLVNFICGEDDRLEYQHADQKLLELAKTIPYKDGNIHNGIIGSGDVWNNEKDKLLWLNEKYGSLCGDMESIAIYYVANTFEIPVIGFRIISDNSLFEDETYDRNLGIKAQEFTYEFVLKLINNL